MKIEIFGMMLFIILFMGCIDTPGTPSVHEDDTYEYDDIYGDDVYDDTYGEEDEIEDEIDTKEEEKEEHVKEEIIVPTGGMIYCVYDYPDGKMEYYFSENEAVLKQTNHLGDWIKTFIKQEEICIEQYWYDDYYESGGMGEVSCVPHSDDNQYMEEIESFKKSANVVGRCSEIDYDSKHFEFT